MADIDAVLRQKVRQRASGLCEYCRISEQFTLAEHELDHIISLKHAGQTTPENLALCCSICNRFKGSDIASIDLETGQLTRLFNPRADQWDNHFQLRDGEIIALTAPGRVTVRLLRMNRSTRIRERRMRQAF